MRQRWLSGRAFLLHIAVLIIAPFCLVAGWWQATRAMSGNTLSYAYAVEWPIFSIIGIVMWWQLIHEDPEVIEERRAKKRQTRRVEEPPPPDRFVRQTDLETDELRAYNNYLAGIPQDGSRRRRYYDKVDQGSQQ